MKHIREYLWYEEQLDLWPVEGSRVPWGGASLRDLTRGGKLVIFKGDRKKMPAVFDPLQVEVFHEARTSCDPYRGAQTLLPLPYEEA